MSEMITAETVNDLKRLRRDWRAQNESIGFVPTMGALHDGHMTLVQRARQENARVVVSIFVNPTQFNDPKDLELYPRPLVQDLERLRQAGTDAVFLPEPLELYQDRYRFEVQEKELSRILCGPKRPGHFTGVLTVVLKLLNIVSPERAYFGEKDFQQLKLVQDMAQAFYLDTEIIGCPTVREADGLAMSSRNVLLTPEQRRVAPALFQILSGPQSLPETIQQLAVRGFKVDYVEEFFGRRLAAVFLGSVRLIDNVEL